MKSDFKDRAKASTIGEVIAFAERMKLTKSQKTTEKIIQGIDEDFWPENG